MRERGSGQKGVDVIQDREIGRISEFLKKDDKVAEEQRNGMICIEEE